MALTPFTPEALSKDDRDRLDEKKLWKANDLNVYKYSGDDKWIYWDDASVSNEVTKEAYPNWRSGKGKLGKDEKIYIFGGNVYQEK
ncbi:hypothetical protein NQ176_g4854 [Zarea fungicola]|uniref:Uncharacterized protein n=1 Tax=Zarea fungicola TaxID=93591 RepID=A0ACC1NCL1_9HYPO|nr:hypothetical protein NQ176_g4854 [Lecanicillium fungicola]